MFPVHPPFLLLPFSSSFRWTSCLLMPRVTLLGSCSYISLMTDVLHEEKADETASSSFSSSHVVWCQHCIPLSSFSSPSALPLFHAKQWEAWSLFLSLCLLFAAWSSSRQLSVCDYSPSLCILLLLIFDTHSLLPCLSWLWWQERERSAFHFVRE